MEKTNKTKSNDNMMEKADKIKSRDNYVAERMQAIQNNMLGTYNKQGEYVINDRIVTELVALKKLCKDASKGEIYCTAKTKSGKLFNFQIRMNTYPLKNTSIAKLYLLEDVERLGGKQTKTVKTKIAKFTDEISDNFFEKAIDYFNVYIDEDNKGQEVKDDQVSCSDIEIRSALNKAMSDRAYNQFNDTYKRLFNDKFYYLRRSNSPFAGAVLAEFMEDLKSASSYYYKDSANKIPNYTAMYNLLSDKIIECENRKLHQNDNSFSSFLKFEEQIGYRESGLFDSFFGDPFNFFDSGFDMLNGFSELWGNDFGILDGDCGILGDFIEGIGDVFESGVEFIKDKLEDVGDFIEEKWEDIKDFMGINGNDKQKIKEANGLYIDKYVEKYTQIEQEHQYSNNTKEKYNNLYKNKESNNLVDKFKEIGKEENVENLKQIVEQNNVKSNNLKIKAVPFQENNINQQFEIAQHKNYSFQTNKILSEKVLQNSLEMTKNLRKF